MAASNDHLRLGEYDKSSGSVYVNDALSGNSRLKGFEDTRELLPEVPRSWMFNHSNA